MPAAVSARLREQRGALQLTELLVVAIVLPIVLGAAFLAYNVAASQQSRAEARVRTSIAQQLVLHKMTRDLRQATKFYGGGTSTDQHYVEFKALVKPSACAPAELGDCLPVERHIRYWCSGSPQFPLTCERKEGPAPADGSAGVFDETLTRTILRNVQNSDVFTIDPASVVTAGVTTYNRCPDTVQVKLVVGIKINDLRRPDPANPLVLSDGAELRNPCR